MKKQQTYKLGELIQITERKVSDKIQPKIKVGELYLVLKEEKPTKSGAICLSVINYDKAFDGYIAGMTNINPKLVMRCNADRFEWIKKSRAKVKEEFSKRQIAYLKQQEKIQDQQIQDKFTDKERIRMAYVPYLFAELAWHYAYKAVDLSVQRRVDDLKKAVRNIKQLRSDFLCELRKKMSQPVLEAAQKRVSIAMDVHSLDFFKFENTIKNEVEREYLGSKNNDIRAYAYMSMLCYESQRRVDIDNAKLISKKLGGSVSEIESYKYMKELYENVGKCLGAYYIPHTDNINIAVKVMEKNINSMEL